MALNKIYIHRSPQNDLRGEKPFVNEERFNLLRQQQFLLEIEMKHRGQYYYASFDVAFCKIDTNSH